MKRILALGLLMLLLLGCSAENNELDRAMGLRAQLLNGEGCSFDAEITADYGDKTYTFAVSCTADNQGNVAFTVTEPESIRGITGAVDENTGNLTFDDVALSFGLLADDQVTPVSAPWIFLHTLRSGYVTACGAEGEGIRISIDDSYADDALELDIWLDANDIPVQAEIAYKGRRILSLTVKNFDIL